MATVTAIVTAAINYYLKPKVRLKVVSHETMGKEYGNVRGFQIKLRFKNEGKRIASRPTVAVTVRPESLTAQFLRVRVVTEDGRQSVNTETIVNTYAFPYKWDTAKGRSNFKRWEEMRKGDEASVVLPDEQKSGSGVASVSTSRSFYSEYHNVVQFMPAKYEIIAELKCEDPADGTTVTKPWTKTIDLRSEDSYSKYWLGIGGKKKQ